MLATVDANKFIKALHAYNQSLKSPLNFTDYINKNNDLITDLFTQQKLNAMFEIKSAKKVQKSGHIKNKEQKKDFVSGIRFFKDLVEPDKLLSGLGYKNVDCSHSGENFIIDLTRVFKQKYMVGKVVGQGAYASVRIAIQKESQQKVAIKVYEKSKIAKMQRKKSIQREIRILTQLNHKNIVKIVDVIQTNNHLNIVMEYLSGTPLSEFVKKKQNRKLSQQECKSVIKGLAEALIHMKSLNVSHRDIKIQNVILDEKLNPKLIDFGFSTCVQHGKKVQLFCGTPNYMAPEIVLRNHFCGLKSDIWALGVLFFVIATGVYPFKGSTDQQLYKKITNLQYPLYLLDTNYKMTQLLKRMLQFDPDSRITPQQVPIAQHKIINHAWLKDQNKYYICTTKNTKNICSPVTNKKQRINTTISALSNYKQNKSHSKNKQKSSLIKQQSKIPKLRQSLNNTLKPKNISSNSKTQIIKISKQKEKSKSKVKIQKITYEKSLNKAKVDNQKRKLSRSKSKIKLN